MRHELQAKHPDLAGKVKFYIDDVRNMRSVEDAVQGVDYIFHAAVAPAYSGLSVCPRTRRRILSMPWEFPKPCWIKAGNPLTITNPNMTRFLMNLDEAVEKILTTDYVREAMEKR